MSKSKQGMPVESVTGDALQLTQLMLDMLRGDIARLEKAGAAATARDKQQVSGMLTKLMRAAATMVKEARALVKDTKALFESMSLDDQVATIVEIVRDLPAEAKARVLKALR